MSSESIEAKLAEIVANQGSITDEKALRDVRRALRDYLLKLTQPLKSSWLNIGVGEAEHKEALNTALLDIKDRKKKKEKGYKDLTVDDIRATAYIDTLDSYKELEEKKAEHRAILHLIKVGFLADNSIASDLNAAKNDRG